MRDGRQEHGRPGPIAGMGNAFDYTIERKRRGYAHRGVIHVVLRHGQFAEAHPPGFALLDFGLDAPAGSAHRREFEGAILSGLHLGFAGTPPDFRKQPKGNATGRLALVVQNDSPEAVDGGRTKANFISRQLRAFAHYDGRSRGNFDRVREIGGRPLPALAFGGVGGQ